MSLFGKSTTEEKVHTEAPKQPKKSVTPKKKGTPEVQESVLANKVLRRPRITEKAYTLNAHNQYVFEVTPRANKKNIAQAVQEAYGVRVVDVKIINLPSKAKTFGRRQEVGSQSAVKKAIVKLQSGDTLEIFKAGI